MFYKYLEILFKLIFQFSEVSNIGIKKFKRKNNFTILFLIENNITIRLTTR